MLGDVEAAMAMVEGQSPDLISAVKNEWQQALENASKVLKWPEGFIVQYNPAIWRRSRYPVGMRLLSDPYSYQLIFEFATPNSVLPFDCFEPAMAKVGVMLHEIAHLIDDNRWGFDLNGLAAEAGEFITREQRAEILAFACCPVGVFEANLAMVESTARMLKIDIGGRSRSIAVVETMGHAGLAGETDPIEVFRKAQADGFRADRILENYLCTFAFSLAGLTTVPENNGRAGLGIKRSRDLVLANEWLCGHLREEMNLSELQELLMGIGYYAFSEEGYNSLGCVDFSFIDWTAARKGIAQAREYFGDEPCFEDFRRTMTELERRLRGEGGANL